jgi:tetratricopeptide (TPR) repeat protein
MKKNYQAIICIASCLLFTASGFGQSDTWQKLMAVAASKADLGNLSDAEATYREALAIAEKFGDKDARLAGTLAKLGLVQETLARHSEATASAKRALIVLDKWTNSFRDMKPGSAPEADYYKTETIVAVLADGAEIYTAQSNYVEAEPLLKTIVALRESSANKLPARNNDDFIGFRVQATAYAIEKLAKAYEQLAAVYIAQNKLTDAEALYRQALVYLEQNAGNDQSSTAKMNNRLGELYFKQNKLSEAESSFVKALTLYKGMSKSGQASPGADVAMALSNLATLYWKQETNFDQANSYFKQALTIFQKVGWTDQVEVAVAMENYSLLLKKAGDEAQAAELERRAQAIRSRRLQSRRD